MRTRQQISKIVVNGLREAIKYHGPISKSLIGSAAKRITGVLVTELKNEREISNDQTTTNSSKK